MRTKIQNRIELIDRLRGLGFTLDEAEALRRIEMTLHRWDESECGDGNDHASWCVERDEETGKPFRVVYPHEGKSYRTAIPDREAGALKRLAGIMAAHEARRKACGVVGEALAPSVVAYHQGDCRGCALYIVRASDIPTGASLGSCYSNGVAVAA